MKLGTNNFYLVLWICQEAKKVWTTKILKIVAGLTD